MQARHLTLLACLAALVPFTLGVPPALGSDPAPRAAVLRAQDYIRDKHGARLKKGNTFSLRSHRNRRWALVDGFTTADRPWAVWLRFNGRRWIVKSGGVDRTTARVSVPCDIANAFSEPAC